MKKFLTRVFIGIAAIAHLPLGPVASAQAADERGGDICVPEGEPWVYDATGKPVGQYSNGAAIISIGDARIFVRLQRPDDAKSRNPAPVGWDVSRPAPRVWPSADCSGPPYVVPFLMDYVTPGVPTYYSVAGEPGERPAAIVRDASGDLIAYIAGQGPTTPQPYQSYFEGNQCVQSSNVVRAWAVERSVNISKLYPEPLTVRGD